MTRNILPGVRTFLGMLAVHCYSIYAGAETTRVVTKLLLVPCLLFFLLGAVPGYARKGLRFPLAALFFSFLGDFFLLGSGTTFFLLGMVSFIITHICNAAYFLLLQRFDSKRPFPALIAFIVILTGILLVYGTMKNNLGAFRVPILIYMAIIGLMGVLAANVAANITYRASAFIWLIPGAVLFIISDAILALDKFHWHAPATWAIPVMATYGLAQLFLVQGFIALSKAPHHPIPNS